MLTEDDVIAAVCNKLREMDFDIEQALITFEKGIDIIAFKGDYRLFIEAKGETSSKRFSSRYGKPFNQNQIKNHVGKGVIVSDESDDCTSRIKTYRSSRCSARYR